MSSLYPQYLILVGSISLSHSLSVYVCVYICMCVCWGVSVCVCFCLVPVPCIGFLGLDSTNQYTLRPSRHAAGWLVAAHCFRENHSALSGSRIRTVSLTVSCARDRPNLRLDVVQHGLSKITKKGAVRRLPTPQKIIYAGPPEATGPSDVGGFFFFSNATTRIYRV